MLEDTGLARWCYVDFREGGQGEHWTVDPWWWQDMTFPPQRGAWHPLVPVTPAVSSRLSANRVLSGGLLITPEQTIAPPLAWPFNSSTVLVVWLPLVVEVE